MFAGGNARTRAGGSDAPKPREIFGISRPRPASIARSNSAGS
jgi:hypothetical protein